MLDEDEKENRMSGPKSQEQAIIEELQKTGYPTEIVSASIMQRRAWGILHNPSYLDASEGHSREFDIRAYREWTLRTTQETFYIGAYLIIECKKSEKGKPWVFFTTPAQHNLTMAGPLIKGQSTDKVIFTTHSNAISFVSDDTVRSFHHYFKQDRLARTFHEPFKKQEKSDHSQMIYPAVMSAVKATLFHYNQTPLRNYLRIFYPVIVFNGDLFEAQVDASKNITLTPSQYIQLSFHYIEPISTSYKSAPNVHQFIIDVVHEEYLDYFLLMVEEEHKALATHLEKMLINQ